MPQIFSGHRDQTRVCLEVASVMILSLTHISSSYNGYEEDQCWQIKVYADGDCSYSTMSHQTKVPSLHRPEDREWLENKYLVFYYRYADKI